MNGIISLLLSLIFVLSSAVNSAVYLFTPTVEFDASSGQGEIFHGACGFLYGLAEEGVPSPDMVSTLNISSVSQKLKDGLQHPIGDIDHVAANFDTCDYLTVYLQDAYPTWYYSWEEIENMRSEGTYDWYKFVTEDFLPRIEKPVTELSQSEYSDRVVYCLYNECDNAVWFGTRTEEGWNAFDAEARQRFYEGWKLAYDKVKSINPGALIGGPGYCDYDINEIGEFLLYCKENSCMPDVMIYHELSPVSSMWWRDHVREYRQFENDNGIDPLEIVISEYGTMEECGVPAPMLRYITACEESGTYGNIAYWRLADNLCDTCAKGNLTNSAWWLYRWYSSMNGERLNKKVLDLFHSDVENVIKYRRDSFHLSKLDGLACLDKDGKRIDIICAGSEYDYQLAVRNAAKKLGSTSLRISIEAVAFEGLSGEVCSPALIADYTARSLSCLKIPMNVTDRDAVYHITVTPYDGAPLSTDFTALPRRFEFENGELTGRAYTYDSAYGTTGEVSGMCGGFENEGDGVILGFDVPESGEYNLKIIFGKCNDGKSPAARKDGKAVFNLDGAESTISFPNTVKSEYTDYVTVNARLEKGAHTLSLAHLDGTFVVDSLLVSPADEEKVYSVYDKDRGEYLVIAPRDGYYSAGPVTRYLRHGVNYLNIPGGNGFTAEYVPRDNMFTVNASGFEYSSGASCETVCGLPAACGISSSGGEASFKVNAPEKGEYAITVEYSNNAEGGLHAYNVDLIEQYVTVTAGGKSGELWCVNTYSDYNKNSAVLYAELEKGENEIILSNSGRVLFNGNEAFAPRIYSVSVNPAVL